MKMLKHITAILALSLITFSTLSASERSITLGWAAWDPANALVELSKDFTKETGIEMKYEFVPWPNFADRMLNELNSGGKTFDVLIGDSQWIGAGAVYGHYVKLNDFFDKEIDAINEPNRPIPSGKISIKDVKIQIWVLLIAGLIVAFLLDLYAKHSFPSVLLLALGGSFVSYIYSAPPLKLKQNGWLGNYALGASYIALPWWAGQALFGKLTIVTAILTLAYSLSGLGIAVINDFKSVEGDSKLGLNSLPVVFGIKNASRISAGLIDIFQLAMVVVLVIIGQHLASVILVLLVIPQITFQDMWLLRDPLKFDVKYQASAQPFLITGMLVTALAIGHSFLVA